MNTLFRLRVQIIFRSMENLSGFVFLSGNCRQMFALSKYYLTFNRCSNNSISYSLLSIIKLKTLIHQKIFFYKNNNNKNGYDFYFGLCKVKILIVKNEICTAHALLLKQLCL